jgi:DNA-binding HxlR family transcriptional regulator
VSASKKLPAVDCPIRELLVQLADKWSIMVLITLADGPVRFNKMKRLVEGISQKVLTQTLRRLAHNGLISRTATATVPVTVEYALTPLGQSLSSVFDGLRAWMVENLPQVHAARMQGSALVCSHHGTRASE